MKYVIRNPKSEGRNPKEGRRSKSEKHGLVENRLEASAFWGWGSEQKSELVSLREEPTKAGTPRDLQERTALFGEAVFRLAKKLPQNPINNRLIDQIIGAAASVGANYCEADDAVSGKEFKQKIGFSRKESKETMFFLRMIAAAEPAIADEARGLWREAKELNLIFGSIWRK